uniref:DNA topoisomerase (ATP-hydrolyzing) n=1 Tax=viral metagenome TaxID=1070528 RepID=A0A6C0BLC5_9ZZZZ
MEKKPTAVVIKLKQPVEIKLKSPSENPTQQSPLPGQIEQLYQRMELEKQILLRPGTYIGDTKSCEQEMFVYDSDSKQMIKKKIKFVPGLYKIYDEGIVNIRDHHINMLQYLESQEQLKAGQTPTKPLVDPTHKYHPVKNIKILIDMAHNQIILKNDGDGIDVVWHNKEKMYVPELIFGHLLTGTNFDDKVKRTVGGQNGFGAKLINLFSTEFIVETVDSHRGLKYRQRYTHNMTICEPPVITSCQSAPYTMIQFTPDLSRFGLTSLHDDDTVQLMHKRAYDIAACTSKEVTVWYNDEKLEIKTFERYVDLYIGGRGQCKRVYSMVNDDWEIAVCASPDNTFEQVSFVNGICTYRGGKHVDHAANIISSRLVKYATENKKGMSQLNAKNVKDNMWLFINTTMVNPPFDTQTKECFTQNITEFRSRCDVSDDFVEKISQSRVGILDKAIKLSEFKSGNGLKKSDGKKKRLVKLDKLIDACYAGDSRVSGKCTLILTEGNSAQTIAVSGLAAYTEEERKYYGIMPLKGKIINPKDSKVETIEKNDEFVALKQVLGLKQGGDYSGSTNGLRYGRIILMTDADVDGDHIKGLGFNLFHEFWVSLLKIDGFFCSLLTPIVKLTHNRSGEVISLYSLGELEQWKKAHAETMNQWKPKYYKGLGTHNATEAKDIFRKMKLQKYSWNNLSRKIERDGGLPPMIPTTPPASQIPNTSQTKINSVEPKAIDVETSTHYTATTSATANTIATNLEAFRTYYTNNGRHPCDLAMELAFSEKNADYRKGWITNYLSLKAKGLIDLDLHKLPIMSYFDFINEKLVEFSVYDNERSVPSMVDGLKPGQRKILFTMFQKNYKKEIKVAELAGIVSSVTAYHHGEVSLEETIIGMAQDFPGANNLNLLIPDGGFGSRKGKPSSTKDDKKGKGGIGKDASASRYLFTALNSIAKMLFNRIDETQYQYIDDDGKMVEPRYYVPILPMVLINGARGIGTGWSTDVPSFNPRDVISNVDKYIQGQPMDEMQPWYRGFRGTIVKLFHQKYRVTGVYQRTGPTTIQITELPLGSARDSKCFIDYKNFVESMIIDESETDTKKRNRQILANAETLMTDKTIKVTLFFQDETQLNELLSNRESFEKTFKLSHAINTSNMNLFNADGIMTKYINPEDILTDYCQVRLRYYVERKKYLLNTWEQLLLKINEKIRFITYLNDDAHEVKVKNKSKQEIVQVLEKYHFMKMDHQESHKKYVAPEDQDDTEPEANKETTGSEEVNLGNYDYLLKMPIHSLTLEQIRKLENERDEIQQKIDPMKQSTVQQLWSQDLQELKDQLVTFETQWSKDYQDLGPVVARVPCGPRQRITIKHTIPKIAIKLKQ